MLMDACPKCQTTFNKKRKNQKYCSDKCRKNGTRSSRLTEYLSRNSKHFARAASIKEAYLNTPTGQQSKFIAGLLERSLGDDAALRNILLHPALLGTSHKDANIASITNRICMRLTKRTSVQIIRDKDFESVSLVKKSNSSLSQSCGGKPDGWDYRNILPSNLQKLK